VDNAPVIILFWLFGIALFMLMTALAIAAVMLMKKDKEQNTKMTRLGGKICLFLSILCSIPIVLVLGYILYLYIT